MAFEMTFKALRALYTPFEERAVLIADTAERYYLGTHEVRARDGYRTGFGGVERHKSYVSVHLMPLYVHPEMVAALDPALRSRMQGKSCFNFRDEDPHLFEALAETVSLCAERFTRDGRLRPPEG